MQSAITRRCRRSLDGQTTWHELYMELKGLAQAHRVIIGGHERAAETLTSLCSFVRLTELDVVNTVHLDCGLDLWIQLNFAFEASPPHAFSEIAFASSPLCHHPSTSSNL